MKIIYRAWHSKEKRYYYFTLSELIVGKCVKCWSSLSEWNLGIKSSNVYYEGEIYEGDIVKIDLGNNEIHIREVKFRYGILGVDSWCSPLWEILPIFSEQVYTKSIELLGNKLENPELSEG